MIYESVVVLTGAGLSAESGLSTFRDKDGIWARYDWRDVASPEGFARNPQLVHAFYNNRRRANSDVEPNAAHFALARLERDYPSQVLTVTQNIDPLHGMAGSQRLIHMHGELLKALCALCGARHEWGLKDIGLGTACPTCGGRGGMRPDVVWFGEVPYDMERIYDELQSCELFIAIGTSGTVHPAASFVSTARETGAYTVELNLEPSEGVSRFHEVIQGKATEIVPAFVDRLLDEARAPSHHL
jgi:NAD-dependent deacetylase